MTKNTEQKEGMAIKNEIIDELLKDEDPKTVFSSEGLLWELKKSLS